MNTWVLNFANSIVGVGILAIPFCFHVCGIGIACLMILATNLITRKTCEYLLKSGQLTRKSGYETLADHLLGPIGKLITELGIIGLLLGTIISFQVVIGDLAPGLFNSFFGFPETWSLRTMLMCISCMGVVPLALMRNLSSLANMNALSMGFYCIFIIVVFLISFKNLLSGEWMSHVNFWKPDGIFHCLPILSLAFSCQTQVFVMYEAIPEPSIKAMMDIIDRAINLVTVMYLSVGIFGYIAFYEAGIRGDILSNLANGLVSNTVKTGFWVSIMMSFPLIIFPLRLAIHSLLFSREKKVHNEVISSADDYIPQHRFTGITLLLIGGSLIVGILIPHIETVLSITGAVIGTFLCFVFPAGLYILATAQGGSGRTLSKVIFVIGVICMIASTMAVLSGGSSEAEHKQHPGHEEQKRPLEPNLLVVPSLASLEKAKPGGQLQIPKGVPDKQVQNQHQPGIQDVLKKRDDLAEDKAAMVGEKKGDKGDAVKVAPTTKTVTDQAKDEKRKAVEQKGDTRKLQQVNNESNNDPQIGKKVTETPEPVQAKSLSISGKTEGPDGGVEKMDQPRREETGALGKGTAVSDSTESKSENVEEKGLKRVKKDEGSLNSEVEKNTVEEGGKENRISEQVVDQNIELLNKKDTVQAATYSSNTTNTNSNFSSQVLSKTAAEIITEKSESGIVVPRREM